MTAPLSILSPISKNRLYEEIVGQLQERILHGELPAGSRLPAERDLAQALGVNRGTVREAIKKLEMLGLVEIRHGDGIYVKNYLESGNLELLKSIIYSNRSISLDILKNILDLRAILAPEMAGVAARQRSSEDLTFMKDIIADGSKSVAERDLGLHHAIARATKNILYIFILNFFNQLFRDYGHLYFDDNENEKRSERFHRDIVAAIEKKKSDEAHKIMKEVLAYTEKKIYAYYEKAAGTGAAGNKS